MWFSKDTLIGIKSFHLHTLNHPSEINTSLLTPFTREKHLDQCLSSFFDLLESVLYEWINKTLMTHTCVCRIIFLLSDLSFLNLTCHRFSNIIWKYPISEKLYLDTLKILTTFFKLVFAWDKNSYFCGLTYSPGFWFSHHRRQNCGTVTICCCFSVRNEL